MVRRSGIHCYPWLHSQLESCLGYMSPCPKQTNKTWVPKSLWLATQLYCFKIVMITKETQNNALKERVGVGERGVRAMETEVGEYFQEGRDHGGRELFNYSWLSHPVPSSELSCLKKTRQGGVRTGCFHAQTREGRVPSCWEGHA